MNTLPPLPWSHPRVWALPTFALLALAMVHFGELNRPLFHLFNGVGPATTPWLWANLTVLGDGLVIFSLALLFAGRRPDLIWALLLAGVIGLLMVHGLKETVWTYRPPRVLGAENINIIGPALVAVSFPSGHTAAAFAFVGMLFQLSDLSRWLRGLLLALAALVAVSRMAVGVHWPVDVLAGAGIGWLAALFGYAASRRMAWGTRPAAQRVFVALLIVAALQLALSHESGYPRARAVEIALGLGPLLFALPGLWRLYRPAAWGRGEVVRDAP